MINIKNILTLGALVFPMMSFAQKNNNNNYQSLPNSNFEYQYFTGKIKSEKNVASIGDRIKVNYQFLVDDSLVYGGDVKAVTWVGLNRNFEGANAVLYGLPYPGLHYLNKGDSVHFRINTKTFFNTQQLDVPSGWKEDGYVSWKIKVLDYQTPKGYDEYLNKLRVISNDFNKVDDALEYKFIALGNGNQKTEVGNLMTINVNYKIADSLIFSSTSVDDGKPVPHQINLPTGVGDLMQGFMLLKEGDSVVFRIKAKDLAKLYNAQRPSFVNDEDYHYWEVKVVTNKTQEQIKADKEAHIAKQNATDDAIIKQYLKDNNYTTKAVTTSNGLVYIPLKAGEGESPKTGQTVTVNYTGMFIDGKKFDSNVDPTFNHLTPFSFTIGKKQVIDGWDQGLQMMKKGEKGILVIPSVLGYGERSNNVIPANAVLVFEVELLEIK
jgi:FKBP-type peptidyl-prolyl cis-trans isomerase FkpA